MIDAKVLLTDLTRLLKRLEDDLRERALSPSSEVPELRGQLQAEWQAAREAERTAETFETWVEQVITQAGVHWLLSCVFLRFIEDNGLVERPWISGTPQSGRLALARDGHDAYFRAHPHQNDRDFLIASFREAGALPGLHTFFDEAHNPVFRLGISGDAAVAVMQFWQDVAADSGLLVRDFTDPTWNTRFLGDLYQDLSEATRKRYALLQTPEFVEEFILNRTLTPAIQEFGYRETRLIDPTCGSGHFLLGAFHRLVEEWARNEPGRNPSDVAQKALDAVAGVDLNPFAVAIARFRLLLAALQIGDMKRLINAPDFKINVSIGDSLLHGSRFGLSRSQHLFDPAETHANTGLAHAYASEDLADVQRILGRQYHAVVGNPPYIVCRDAALNAAYRARYSSCHMQFSLGAPFTECFFELAVTGTDKRPAGFVGLITANSFMKREFGSKLIEKVLPRLDLTHVVDTSGAYIPGHGTPTVIMFGRHRPPISDSHPIRTVMGIKGEPATPDNPAAGLVWSAIARQIDHAGSEGEFVSVADTPRSVFGKHPWSIGGGGATDLKEAIEGSDVRLAAQTTAIGRVTHTGADDVYLGQDEDWARRGVRRDQLVPLIEGTVVRDWAATSETQVLFPYNDALKPVLAPGSSAQKHLWYSKAFLSARREPGGTHEEIGLTWFEWSRFQRERFLVPLGITYADIATHNHFVLDRGGKVFNRTAPVIKLLPGTAEGEHLALLGLLNSSVVCFWLKQVSHQKQMMGGDGIRVSEKSKVPYQFASTRLQELPLPATWREHPLKPRLTVLARETDKLIQLISSLSARQVVERCLLSGEDISAAWQAAIATKMAARSKSILLQEEIDFLCYSMYGLTSNPGLVGEPLEWDVVVDAGCRPFCLLRQANVDGFEVPVGVPNEWPPSMRSIWANRIGAIQESSSLKTIEDPHYKRRWIGRQGLFNHGARADEFRDALVALMLLRLESAALWIVDATSPPQIGTTNCLADAVQNDNDFMRLAALYAGRADFDLAKLVAELVAPEAVPFLPVLRYADSGMRARAQWETTWSLQRHEDRIDAEVEAEAPGWREEFQTQAVRRFGNATTPDALAWIEDQLAKEIAQQKVERKENEVGKIPVPPKYQSKDFLKSDVWRLRGGLDVPKERWVSYPGCERGADGSLPIAWAGWDHLQQAMALASYFIDMKEREGWGPERLQPLLAGLLELVPWLKQWHNEMNPDFGARMGDYYESFVTDEARALQFTLDDLRAWKPSVTAAKRGRKKAA